MRKVSAFSLIELLITLSIIIILLAITLPSEKLFFNNTVDQLAAYQLLRAIQLARQEAMVRGSKVTLCQSQDARNCGGDWRDGYIIQANQKTLFSFKSKAFIHWRAFPKTRTDLQFLPNGMTYAENGTFWYCDQDKVRWAIVISQSGRARMVWPDKWGKVAASVNC